MAKSVKRTRGKPTAAKGLKRKILAAYKNLLSFQFLGTVVLALMLSTWLLIAHIANVNDVPILPLVVLMGVLGAFFSALTRLYKVDEVGAALITPTVGSLGDRYLFMYSFVPPMIGAIAAAVLYLLFISKLVEGSLFPTLACKSGEDCSTMQGLMHFYFPAEPADYGKTMVWAFIAGYSERLVPNLLEAMAAKQRKAPK